MANGDKPPLRLSIEFSGLCAFVIPEEGAAAVLLLDPSRGHADHTHGAGEEGSATHLPAHEPYLVADARDVVTKTAGGKKTSNPERIVAAYSGRQDALWRLDGCDVFISPGLSQPQEPPRLPEATATWPSDDEFWTNVRERVANMARIARDGRIDPRVLGELPDESIVSARVWLTGGTLRGLPPRDPDFRQHEAVFYFKNGADEVPRDAHRQYATDRVRYDVETQEGELILDVRPRLHATSASERQIVFTRRSTSRDVTAVTAAVSSFPAMLFAEDEDEGRRHISAFASLLDHQPSANHDLTFESLAPPAGPGTIYCPAAMFRL